MAIQIDAAAMEARFANKVGAPAQPAPMQDLSGIKQSQIPIGTPVPEGVMIQQHVGRGQPSMAVVPPKQPDVNAPAMAVVPPTGSARTSLGTYVEVSRTVSNPLDPPQPQPSVDELTAEPKKKLDLTQAILDHIFELGGEKSEDCQKFYDRSQQTLLSWVRNPAIIPLGAILKFLHKAPEVRDDII